MTSEAKNEFSNMLSKLQQERDQYYLYRYLDWRGFLFFITMRSLHCTRLDQLEDAFEGRDIKRLLLLQRNKSLSLFKSIQPENQDLLESIFNNEKEIEERRESELLNPKRFFVNCWYRGKKESPLMWKSFSDVSGITLKIPEETLPAIIKSFNYDEGKIKHQISKVKYVDMKNLNQHSYTDPEIISEFVPLYKDDAYLAEQEVRIIYEVTESNKILNFLEINLDHHEVGKFHGIFHPKFPKWLKEPLREITKRFHDNFKIVDSELDFR